MPLQRRRDSTAKATSSSRESTLSKRRKSTSDGHGGEEQAVAQKPRTLTKPKPTTDWTQTEIGSIALVDELEPPIFISRAPVLELWGACVAHFTHPDFSWDLCLSIGSSIASVPAVSQGRSIGTIQKLGKAKEDSGGSHQTRKAEDEGLTTVQVMGCPMTIQDDLVVVKGKPKSTREANLQRKYGDGRYEKVKDTMLEALGSWKGEEDELDGKAFHLYERFRPDVAKGLKGWGRKGDLHLSRIKNVMNK